MPEELATIEAASFNLEDVVMYGTMENFDEYDHAYLHLQDGRLQIIASIPGESASTYAEFHEGDLLDSVSSAGETEALIDIEDFLFYLENAEQSGPVTVTFHGEEENRLASFVEIEGSLTSSVYIPSSSKILEQMPLYLPDSFTEDGNYERNEKQLQTKIQTEVKEIQRIVNIVDSDKVRGVNEYPLVVQDGELALNVQDENSRSSVSGSLNAVADGPDLAVTYQTGFSEAIGSLSGEIAMRASPGGSPLLIEKNLDDGVVRHLVGHTGTV